MIKNGKQAAITREKLASAIKEKKDYLDKSDKDIPEDAHKFYLDSFNGIIDELQHQLDEYEHLKNGNLRCLKCDSLTELPKLLIGARIAQGLSQSALADKLGIPEQQIQRYESMDYDAASFYRLVAVCDALNLRLSFKDTIIIGYGPKFELPNGVDPDKVSKAELATRFEGSLIL